MTRFTDVITDVQDKAGIIMVASCQAWNAEYIEGEGSLWPCDWPEGVIYAELCG
jgi:hypothetical protein